VDQAFEVLEDQVGSLMEETSEADTMEDVLISLESFYEGLPPILDNIETGVSHIQNELENAREELSKLTGRGVTNDQRYMIIRAREKDIYRIYQGLNKREDELTKKEATLWEQEGLLRKGERNLAKKKDLVRKREGRVYEKEKALELREKQFRQKSHLL
jgi:hypothetical protein